MGDVLRDSTSFGAWSNYIKKTAMSDNENKHKPKTIDELEALVRTTNDYDHLNDRLLH